MRKLGAHPKANWKTPGGSETLKDWKALSQMMFVNIHHTHCLLIFMHQLEILFQTETIMVGVKQ
jgi:hypothetical protein